MSTPSPTANFWYNPIMLNSWSGMHVGESSAMSFTPVYSAVRLLAETISSQPLHLRERTDDGGSRIARDHYLYDVIHIRPNDWMTSCEFWDMMIGHAVLRGNGFAYIEDTPTDPVAQLIPLHPDRVRVNRNRNTGVLTYDYMSPDGRRVVYSADEMFHLRGLTLNGYVGVSPIEYHRNAIGSGLSADRYAGRFWRNDARPGGVLKHQGRLSEAAASRLRSSWEDAHAGSDRSHRMVVLEEGMDWSTVGMTNEDAQFLETRNFNVQEIARIFRVPPHMLYDLGRATFSNIEEQGREFVNYSLRPWTRRIEQAIARDLIDDPQTYFAQYELRQLQQGDTASRTSYYTAGISGRWLTPNEVREMEGLDPIDGGDEFPAIQGASPETAATRSDDDDTTARLLDVAFADAAKRIVTYERKRIADRASKYDSDPERWREWWGQEIEKTRRYVRRVCKPVIEQAVTSGIEVLAVGDPPTTEIVSGPNEYLTNTSEDQHIEDITEAIRDWILGSDDNDE